MIKYHFHKLQDNTVHVIQYVKINYNKCQLCPHEQMVQYDKTIVYNTSREHSA
jgi:hypothetical protein